MCGRCDRQASEELGRTPEELARPRPLEERLREAFVKYLTQDVMPKGKRAVTHWKRLELLRDAALVDRLGVGLERHLRVCGQP